MVAADDFAFIFHSSKSIKPISKKSTQKVNNNKKETRKQAKQRKQTGPAMASKCWKVDTSDLQVTTKKPHNVADRFEK